MHPHTLLSALESTCRRHGSFRLNLMQRFGSISKSTWVNHQGILLKICSEGIGDTEFQLYDSFSVMGRLSRKLVTMESEVPLSVCCGCLCTHRSCYLRSRIGFIVTPMTPLGRPLGE